MRPAVYPARVLDYSAAHDSKPGREGMVEAAETLAAAVRSGDRRALARAITLVESERAESRAQAEALLAGLLPHAGGSFRVAISGAPGVGKSTLIEALGGHIVAQGRRLAVLAIDPSSPVSGGSILGDKTRMAALAQHPSAFIRPTPTGGMLGGVARRTREAIAVCEAAGFDVVIVETVGVGQSEDAVADMVDMVALLLAPAGGDELQGLKRGIVERADMVVVTKADGAFANAAERVVGDYAAALHFLRPAHPGWQVPVLTASAATGSGVAEIWQAAEAFRTALGPELGDQRRRQALSWLWREIDEGLRAAFRGDPAIKGKLEAAERAVADGRQSPQEAARALLEAFRRRDGG